VLYALSILGVVATSDALPKDLTATGSFPRPLVAPPLPPPVATVPVPVPAAPADPDLERRRNEIMQAYLSYRRQDAFDLLGAPEEGTAAAFEEKFLDFARRFSPWTLPPGDLAEKARDLFLTGARAYAELAESEQRNTLLFRRKTLREERAKRPTASFAIKTDLLDSESQYKKGKTLMDTGKHREALMLLEFAADCDPQNSLYAAELAYCRFLATPANAGRALRELNETLRRDPNCGLAAFYAGEIEAQAGNTAEAEAHLRRAIKLMSPDRRPIEALKALPARR
jgi:tetratricopeptide (TPR) repeat protein